MFWAECRRERKGRFEQVQIVMHNTCHIKGSHSETANGVRLKESIWEEKMSLPVLSKTETLDK